jgi:hypothetical protein
LKFYLLQNILKCGYIDCVIGNEAKKVFFHISDLVDATQNSELSSLLKSGDEVEFQLSHNSRNGKISANKIKKLASGSLNSSNSNSGAHLHAVGSAISLSGMNSSSASSGEPAEKRPERLNIKLKVANIDEKSGKELVLIRQPNNPDTNNKTKSFTRVLVKRPPGNLNCSQLKVNSSSNQLFASTTSEAASPTSAAANSSSVFIFDLLAASNNISKQ